MTVFLHAILDDLNIIGEFPALSLSPKLGDGAGTYFEDPRRSGTGRGQNLDVRRGRGGAGTAKWPPGRGGDRIFSPRRGRGGAGTEFSRKVPTLLPPTSNSYRNALEISGDVLQYVV